MLVFLVYLATGKSHTWKSPGNQLSRSLNRASLAAITFLLKFNELGPNEGLYRVSSCLQSSGNDNKPAFMTMVTAKQNN